ncbi:iron-siderophore ABC transporter substrate-binding protein [Tropicimonas sp. IMCC34011]|uniref:iron-siderophore ABC transporter substrate-binding protein n=1 Tax=Tropicimonas sp. IMCC34011 TaxID=2248759 RepID=UPI000E267AEA|nr:iron-siderophore ABC transporter substrate-binding protein [Tropicimonas sp. IMCC34011]
MPRDFPLKTLLLLGLTLLWATAPTLAAADEFPVTIEHSFGTTTIEAAPKRVATVAWANHEVPLALGIVPVGFARANFGDDDGDGVLPWVSERLEELGADTPALFDEGDGIDFEAVAASRPDVILAAYSGLTRSEYETLSRIAPVIPHRDGAWATDWREVIRLNAAGLGRSDEGEALIGRIEGRIGEIVAEHPEIEGKTAMFVTHLDARDLSVIRFYSANDTRVQFLEDLGLRSPRSVVEASEPGSFSGEVSAERIDEFGDVDIFITYGGDTLLEAVEANPLTSRMKTVENGAIVLLGNDPVGTAANPTPLSIEYVLEDYVARLADAARKAE